MELLELILFLLVAVVASSLLDQVLRGVSLPLVQIISGVLIALLIPMPSSINIDAELLLILFIAPLHFNESRQVDSKELYQNRFGIFSLVTGLVLLTMIAMGATLNALIPAIPFAAALAFGAAMGSTDAAAVTSLAKEMRFGRRHEALLNGEALFNDVTGTIGFQCAIAVVVSGAFSLTHAGEEFALELFGGLCVGVILGFAFWGLTNIMRRYGLDNPTVHVVLELLAPFIIYLICEQIHVGGVIAVVMAGMTISLLPHKRTAASSRQRIQASSVWKTLEFVLNGVIFVVLGIQLPSVLIPAMQGGSIDAVLLIFAVFALTFVLEAVRFCWILGMDLVHTSRSGKPLRICFSKRNLKGTLGMAFAGPKGGVTLALILTIPLTVASGDAFPMRAELLFLASGVIVCTMVLANFAVRKLVPLKPLEKRTKGYADAEISVLTSVINAIQADAHLTGAVTGEQALEALDNSDERDLKDSRDRARTNAPLEFVAENISKRLTNPAEVKLSDAASHLLGSLTENYGEEVLKDTSDESIESPTTKPASETVVSTTKTADDMASGDAASTKKLTGEAMREPAASVKKLTDGAMREPAASAKKPSGAVMREPVTAAKSAIAGSILETAASIDALPENVDEPATAIVMKRYADRIRDLLPLASDDVAKQARALVERCDELYEQANAFSEALSTIYEDEDIDAEGLQAHMLAANRVNEAVDDIQDAALSRELEFIKLAQRAGKLSSEHARELRNDVYVQRMVID